MRRMTVRQARVLVVVLVGAASLVGCAESEESPATSDDVAADASADGGADVDDAVGMPDSGEPETDTPTSDTNEPPVETGPGLGIDWDAVPAAAAPRFARSASDWMAVGWPSDRWRKADGSVDLTNLPGQDNALILAYLEHGMETLDGWGLNGGIYLEVGTELDVASLPSPEASLDELATVQLVNVTADSAAYGRRVPVEFEYYTGDDDPFYATGTLAMRPVFGMGLTEGDTWCAVLTRGVRDVSGGYLGQADAFGSALLEEPWLAGLNAWMEDSPLHREDLATATCFTTQRATGELRAVVSYLDQSDAPQVTERYEPGVYGEFHGLYDAPNFQQGDKPYSTGGGLELDAAGAPIVQSTETIRYLLLTPRDVEMPENGWPTVLYGHGTGGDYESCRGASRDLLAEGLAVVCIDQPLHGSRGPDSGPLDYTELVTFSFNFINPPAGRTNFRQSAIDVMILARMVAAGRLDVAAGEALSGEAVVLDPTRIVVFGHSHGALSGALALGVDPLLRAGVISGGGALLINTILLRKDPLDISALVAAVGGVNPAALTTFHPLLAMVQMLVDATDPVNYAPYWLQPADGGPAKHLFVTEGTSDHASPQITGDTLALAGRLPLVRPLAKQSLGHQLAALAPLDEPVSGNVMGGVATAAARQWQDGTHWVAFDATDARAMWRGFFGTWAQDDLPVLQTPAGAALTYQSLTPGETCDDAGTIDAASLPMRVVGNTTLAADDLATSACGGGSEPNQRDQVFRFVADVAGVYRGIVRVPPQEDDEDPPTGPDRLAIVGDCGDLAGSCFGADELVVDVQLSAGEAVWLIVDGTTPAHQGPYVLEFGRLCEVQECGERECGSWGCGSCGECDAGSVCVEGACETTAAGDVCADPLVLTAGQPVVGSTVGFSNVAGYPSGACPGENNGYGAGSPDVIYTFTAPTADTYRFELEADYDTNLIVADSCGDIAATCRGADRDFYGHARVVLDLDKDESVFVIADGSGNTVVREGHYLLRVNGCVPDCDGRDCGTDGCGGSCGTCGATERCVSETNCGPIEPICTTTAVCEEVQAGDTCGKAIDVDVVPYAITGDTSDALDDYGYGSGQCPGHSGSAGFGGRDHVYRFVPAETGIYSVDLDASFDAGLYVSTACEAPGSSCVGAHQVDKKGTETVYATLEAGVPAFVFVDGHWSSTHSGSYSLSIDACTPSCGDNVCGHDGCGGSCGGCAATEKCSGGQCQPRTGDLCSDPHKITKLPFQANGTTADYTSSLDAACGESVGQGAADVFYRYSNAEAGDYRVTFGGTGVLYVLDGCDGTASCLTSVASGASEVLTVADGTTLRFAIDGTSPDSAATWSLGFERVCVPECEGKACGDDGCGGVCGVCVPPADVCQDGACSAPTDVEGNTCESARALAGPLPLTVSGDTSTQLNHYAFGDLECSALQAKGGAGRDEVWRFEAPADGSYDLEITARFDAALYVVGDCAAIGATCLGAADGWPREVVSLSLVAGQVVWAIVDGSNNDVDRSGAYTLTVREAP